MAQSEWTVGPTETGMRLDRFLADGSRLRSRGRADAALLRGRVFVNGEETSAADRARRLAAGDVVRVWADRPGSARVRRGIHREGALEILYEDAALLVANKPAGLLTVPLARRAEAPSLAGLVARHLQAGRPTRAHVVHRIDRDTSGLVVFAKSRAAQDVLKAQFEGRRAERVYLAIVRGQPSPPDGTWRDRILWDPEELVQKPAPGRDRRAREAVSHYRTVETFAAAALLEISLVTGKRNQIRIQAQLRGHPLLGEQLYRTAGEDPVPCPRQALHAYRLALEHPLHGRRLQIEAPLPPDLRRVLRSLRGGGSGSSPGT